MIKLIVTDMDGTLLDENGLLPDGFAEILDCLKNKNIKFVVASGRPYYTLKTNFGSMSRYLSFICENGSLVIDNNKTIYKSIIAPALVNEIIETSNNIEGNAIILCAENCAYTNASSEEHLNEIKKYYTNLEVVNDLSKISDDIIKISICNLHNSLDNLNNIFKPKFQGKLHVVGSGSIWIDISNNGVNKGVALKSLMKTYNISKEETIAFGDYYNDIEMLSSCEYSFVMENAPEDMKQYGKYIAESNINHGVLKAIIKYAL
ncbi:HAD family hydrolase [Clostridium sp. SM-530-WT-3G]|uniref:Cof-type HAD-IIB family hydrolase n=1 Tax=Clostridium sp. SM-530-WT-3G TaxID=2725303 RepID=UPI00145D1ED2|nr:HAD family hydrolase [Clostridium sp. SM-530-WT-3G]NME84396.1 HAD family phosphatase [Clostridium sp. SM-530-WT-3G]